MANDRAACFNVPDYHRELWEQFASASEQAPRIARAGDAKIAGFSDGFLPELNHVLYSDAPRAVAPTPPAAARARLHALASELPEMETLAKRTKRDPFHAGIATIAIGDSLARALPDRTSTPDADRAARILRGLSSLASVPEMAEHVAGAEGASRGAEYAVAEQAASLDERALRGALRAGIDDAQQAIDDADRACESFGLGDDATTGAHVSPAVALELARRVASSATLRRIVELAGRLQATARAKRAAKSDFARNEIVGVVPTGKLEELIPSELAYLAHPLLTADLLNRVSYSGAMGYELKGKEACAKGPIVVCLDQSGSMQGDRDAWAKAITLALLDAAKRDNRAFGVILYAGSVTASRLFPAPRDADPRDVLDLLSHDADGGSTDYAPAITQALDWISTAGAFKRADIVHVTDGQAATSAAPAAMARAETLGAHLYGVGIATDGGALRAWSHEVACIRDVNADTAAVDLIFDGIL